MGDHMRTILNHYNITHPFPTEWPAENDGSGDSEPEEPPNARIKPKKRKSKSRYSILERGGDQKSLVPGAEKTQDGLENLVQKDEPDPLGASSTVVQALKRKGLPVEEDDRLRNRFLLSSTTFTPALYLSQVHSNATTQNLLQGLEYLSRSIDQKSASLKILVESNFERFVRAKTTIDDVYTEMRNQGLDLEEERPEKSKSHSRHTSRTSMHFRNASGGISSARTSVKAQQSSPGNEKKKHALLKESEYGVQGIKAPLIEVAVKAEEVWGPVLGGREREHNLKLILDSLEKAREVLPVASEIQDAIKRKDYENLVKVYYRAHKYADEAREVAHEAKISSNPLTESQIHQIVITARMWADVEEQIDQFKRGVWRNLTSVQANLTMSTNRSHQEDHVALISVLLELGVEDNPIWVWLLSRYDYLKNKITSTFERCRVEIEVYRRRLAMADKPSLYVSAIHLKSPSRTSAEERLAHLDSRPILELWDLIIHTMTNLLSPQGGILGEVLDFWEKAQSFIDGKAQRTLPTGINDASRKHHRLSSAGVNDLESGAVELVDILRENIFAFLSEPPIEDVSLLFSPMPTEVPNTPHSAALSPFSRSDSRFQYDMLSPPPPSPRRGEAWEEFAFWPPYANSLSGVHYLGKLMVLLGMAASDMASIRPISSEGVATEKLKVLLNVARDRATRAICAAWNTDAQSCKVLEDWTRGPDSRDITRMPSHFQAFEAFVLSGTQKILYIPEAANSKRGSADVVTPPPNKLLQTIRSQFVSSLYKALSGMVENAERPVNLSQNPWAKDGDLMVSQIARISIDTSRDVVDASNRNLRMLLTLSNLKALRSDVVPQLVSQFETDFSVKLSEESKTIYDVLMQIDTRLFQSYTRPITNLLCNTIIPAFTSTSFAPLSSRPAQVNSYVYDALLSLVYVHTEVSTTAPPLTHSILSHLLETISNALLEGVRARQKFNFPALMQATLDIEFFAQTLSQYNTDATADLQARIYQEMDQGTDNGARAKLQADLPELKAVLKSLREGTRSEFACFKKQRQK